MASGNPSVPLGLDPLIAEANQRARRRQALALGLLVVIAGAAAAMYVDLRGSSAVSLGGKSASGSARTPFTVYAGGFGGYRGFMGDSDHGGATRVTDLGCINRRHYDEGFALRNRSRVPVTVLSAQWRSAAPAIIDFAAAQIRLVPYQPGVIETVSRNWTGRSNLPVTIPPNRQASLQSNFIFRHCAQVAGGRPVAGPGSFVVRYRAAGRLHQRVITPSPEAFVIVAGPKREMCAPVSGARSLIASDLSCAVARQAALVCHPLSHYRWGNCTTGKAHWSCDLLRGRERPHVETCDESKKSRRVGDITVPHGFRVRWSPAT